ncbi:hypothetical protein DITRI_Ditri18aG0034400 [Diplodiscus trichospermus]
MPPHMKHTATKCPRTTASYASRPKPSFDQNFQNAATRRMFEKEFALREVKPSRMSYLSMNMEVHENLVKVFYCNTSRISLPDCNDKFYEDKFSSSLLGTTYKITRDVIVEALNLDTIIYGADDSMNFDMLYLAHNVFEDESLRVAPMSAAKLSLYDRILHLIVTHVLAPLGTQYAVIRKQDFWLMYKIKKRSQVDLAGLIFDNMMRVIKTSESTLVYGMALSLIF